MAARNILQIKLPITIPHSGCAVRATRYARLQPPLSQGQGAVNRIARQVLHFLADVQRLYSAPLLSPPLFRLARFRSLQPVPFLIGSPMNADNISLSRAGHHSVGQGSAGQGQGKGRAGQGWAGLALRAGLEGLQA